MKYGLIINKKTENIGDDIQAYAAKRFLPQTDYIIDREELDTFAIKNNINEEVSVIMNGWYMYNKFNWPPTSILNPLPLSMHITADDYWGIGDSFLDGIGGEYLVKHGPVGARDQSTLELLQNKKIPSYLSGCLTLTLQKCKNIVSSNDILLVDISGEVEEKIKEQFSSLNFKSTSNFVDYTYTEKTIEERISNVENILGEYQKARCVITSRLHCALPCLALEVPVILIYKDEFKSRMSSFLDLLHVCDETDVIKNGLNFDLVNPLPNKKEYRAIRDNLEYICTNFINSCQNRNKKKNSSQDCSASVLMWQKDLIYSSWINIEKKLKAAHTWSQTLENTKKYLDTQLESQKAWSEELQNAKDYLATCLEKEQQRSQELSDSLTELKNWSDQLQDAKDYLESATVEQNGRISDIESKCIDYESKISDLENELAKMRYKYNRLTTDSVVKKIIKLRKLDL